MKIRNRGYFNQGAVILLLAVLLLLAVIWVIGRIKKKW